MSVTAIIEITRDGPRPGVHYFVNQGEKTIWSKFVEFGQKPHNRAGGPAFQQAAREQDLVAWQASNASRDAQG